MILLLNAKGRSCRMSYQPTAYDLMQTRNVLDRIFDKMTDINKWQRDFLTLLFKTIFALQGRVNRRQPGPLQRRLRANLPP